MFRLPLVARLSQLSLSALARAILLIACGLPLAWLAWQIVGDPTVLRFLRPDRVRWDILGRTAGYAAIVALLATALAIPAGLAVGLGRGFFTRLLAFCLPVTLLIPSITYAYGWSQCLRLAAAPLGALLQPLFSADSPTLRWLGVLLLRGDGATRAVLMPAGTADVARCVWALATWLWPIPAGAIAITLRQADPSLGQQALLDGATGRLVGRQIVAPLLAAGLAVWALAAQEFAVYEPTGISVVATEVRQIFETGSFSSMYNPITQPMGGAWQGGDIGSGGDAGLSAPGAAPATASDLQQRAAAAAVATAFPLMLLTLAAGTVLWLAGRRWSAAGDELTDTPPAIAVGSSRWRLVLPLAAWGVLALTLGVPIAAMLLRHHRPLRPGFIWTQSGYLVLGSLAIAALTGLVALVIALAACRDRRRWALPLALAGFLVGGQLLAVALLRLYNRPGLRWAADSPPIMVGAYLGRFAWIALLAAGATWSRPWRLLRDQAAIDGAGAGRTVRFVVWPLAWPLLLGGALLVLILSLTEVPATVLATPHRPPQLVPMLMTWVHTLESDPMIEASLLLACVVLVLAAAAVLLVRLGLRAGEGRSRIAVAQPRPRSRLSRVHPSVLIVLTPLALFAPGCDEPGTPSEIWMSNGNGPGQTVYPRAIAYSEVDQTFFVVDRLGRVQHLDHAGRFLNGWQMPESQQGKPVGLTVGADGLLYVPDTHYHRVLVFTPNGALVRQWGENGAGPGQFIYPTDVAFDSLGHIFVSEYGEHDRVQVFDDKGKYLYEFGSFGEGDGQFSRPQSLLIDGELVYITDACNHRLCVFKTDGTFVRNMGGVGSELGQFRFPYGLAMDAAGRLVVCEFGNNRVQWIDKATGQGIKSWGVAGREPGHLAYPWGVVVDNAGRVVVVDGGNNRLQVFSF